VAIFRRSRESTSAKTRYPDRDEGDAALCSPRSRPSQGERWPVNLCRHHPVFDVSHAQIGPVPGSQSVIVPGNTLKSQDHFSGSAAASV
jgi:hypothetical protein